MQAIGEHFSAKIGHAPQVMHGKTSQIAHDGSGLLEGLPDPFTATRYHSLCILNDSLPTGLRITATSEDGVIQGIAHREFPICGVQFHPESILSEQGGYNRQKFLALGFD